MGRVTDPDWWLTLFGVLLAGLLFAMGIGIVIGGVHGAGDMVRRWTQEGTAEGDGMLLPEASPKAGNLSGGWKFIIGPWWDPPRGRTPRGEVKGGDEPPPAT
jgi:hypothetical protein